MHTHRIIPAALATLAFAACSHEPSSPSAANALTTQQALEIGGRMSRELGTSFRSLTLGPQGGMAAALARSAGGTAPANADVVGCPVINSAGDADGDGVPDHAVLTFTQPACRGVHDGDTIEVTGVVELSDPVFSPPPDPAAFGFDASLTNFTVHVIAAESDKSFVETRNGAEQLLFTPGGLSQTHGFSIAHSSPLGSAQIVDQWTMTFTPAQGSILVPGHPLPAGTYAAVGQSSWQNDQLAAQFQLVTEQPLAYDPTCPASGPNQFRSGEIHAARATSSGAHAEIRIIFADCAAPTIVLVANDG